MELMHCPHCQAENAVGRKFCAVCGRALAIPSTLQDSLRARLDRWSSVRELVQLGATLGREFSYDLLRALSPLDDVALQHGLRQGVEAELLYQREVPPQATYFFKHVLIQDVAYQSLLKSRRQQLHQQIAHVLEARFRRRRRSTLSWSRITTPKLVWESRRCLIGKEPGNAPSICVTSHESRHTEPS